MFLKFDSMFGRSVSSAIVIDVVVVVVADVDVDDDDDEGKISGGGRPTWGRFR